ncbi:MAG: GNAT family N-acetyltransferase [Ideonella sp.]
MSGHLEITMPGQSKTLESERLSYEAIRKAHALELADALCDPMVYQFIDDRMAPSSTGLLESFARKEAGAPASRRSETWLDFAMRSKATGEAIGRVEATVLGSGVELAYLLGARHWGSGFAREAVAWLQQLLIDEYEVRDFWATVKPGNERSLALLMRLGFSESPKSAWPARLTTYDEGDLVFHLSATEARVA